MLIVTTTPKPRPPQITRAQEVAARCRSPWVPRAGRSLTRTLREADAELAYVIGRRHELLSGGQGATLHVHPGTFYYRQLAGRAHPLIRAVAPPAARPISGVFDGTLGLAADALQIASVLEVPITGVEASAPLACLLEEGLGRMAAEGRVWSAGAARVSVRHADTLEVLRELADDSLPVVYLDPMFDAPIGAHASFSLLRRVADPRPLSGALLAEAWRVASRRVVLKLPGAAAGPALSVGPGWNRRVRGQAVDYLIIEGELSDPEYEAPTPGDAVGACGTTPPPSSLGRGKIPA